MKLPIKTKEDYKMKFISWNVNGFRAVLKKGFEEIFNELDADFFCLQETKMQEGQADFHPEGYYEYYSYAEKKGYSGTAIFAKEEPLSVTYGIEGKHNDEGRVITLEYDDFYLICAYVPNAQNELKRIDYRMEYEDDLRAYMTELDKVKPVVYCGDRYLQPETTWVYSWWSYRFNARANNAGWRIDYFIVSNRLEPKIKEASILTDVYGSDHCPVSLVLE